MTELDKFKRRMIRAVARLLQEKKSEEDMWEQMKKETGCDCRLLWERMRALTLKKLRRLLLSDDKSENVASIARMSLTDWLLFDLVLVHEKIDFIEKDLLESNKEMKPLVELFYLVQKFQIENLRSNALADAWTAATVIYNSKGHQCSPMLLQRRWYQLKEATRERFYKFWFKYRGNAKQLSGAEQFMPSRLQAAIAKRYNSLVTKPFLEWDKMIDKRLVILPDEFESKMRNINFKMPSDDNGPELILVEPIIETIDLGADSDSDQNEHSPSPSPSPSVPTSEILPVIKVKMEPKDSDINDDDNECDAEMLRAMNKQLPQKVLDATGLEEQALLESENATLKETNTLDPVDIVTDTVSDDVIECTDDTNVDFAMPQISNVFGNVTSESLSLLTAQSANVESITTNKHSDIVIKTECSNTLECYEVENNSHNEEENSALQGAEIIMSSYLNNNSVPHTISSSDEDRGISREDDHNIIKDTDFNQDIVKNNITSEDNFSGNKNNSIQAGTPISSDTSDSVNVQDVIDLSVDVFKSKVNKLENITELVKNIAENLDTFEDDIICINNGDVHEPTGIQDTHQTVKVEDFPVDLNFVDDGIEFADDGIEFVDEDNENYIETSAENNIQHLPIKLEANDLVKKEVEELPKFDLKLLLNPIVYTKKFDDLGVFDENPSFEVKGNDLIDFIEKECKPLCVMSNDVTNIKQEIRDAKATSANEELLNKDSSEESDADEIPDCYKVKVSSYLLQKPKSRTYNPIQLCKNPDFNTRLKRLPVGFFSSTRNCQLLKSCKPMTIDVNNTFENKLINGTIYLKPDNINDLVVQDVDEQHTVSVIPSAMAAQSLIDSTVALPASKQTQILANSYSRQVHTNTPKHDKLISERSRVINLPDISQIRRINQKLLTAEVTPIRVQQLYDPVNTAPDIVTAPERNVEASTPEIQRNQPNVNEIIKIPEKSASEVIDVDKKPIIISDQNPPISTDGMNSSNAFKINDFIKQIEATGSEIAKADPNPGITSTVAIDKTSKPEEKRKITKRNYYPAVPWLSAKRQTTVGIDDSLLTLDTLNKMLKIINGDVIVDEKGQFQNVDTIKKKKSSKERNSKNEASEGDTPIPRSKKTETCKSKDEQMLSTRKRKTKKPKINIIEGYSKRNTTENNSEKRRGRPVSYMKIQAKQTSACVILSDDDDDTALQNACESIERVVRQTQEQDEKNPSVSVSASVIQIVNPAEVQKTIEEEIETSEKVSEATELVIETTKEGFETSEEVIETSEEVIETSEEVFETSEEVFETSEEVFENYEEVIQTSEEVIETCGKAIKTSEKVIGTLEEVIKTPVDVSETVDVKKTVELIQIPAKVVEPLEIQSMITSSNTNVSEHIASDVANEYDKVEATLSPIVSGSTMKVKKLQDLVESTHVPEPIMQILNHTLHTPTLEVQSKSRRFIPTQPIKGHAPQLKRNTTTKRHLRRVLPETYYQSLQNQRSKKSRQELNTVTNYQAKTCSCRMPSVSLDTPKRRIIIDGSSSCDLHSQNNTVIQNNKHKILLMNSKNISKEPTERPISLGKNKILLTTVKIPKLNQPEIIQNPQVIPALPLPTGVKLILLPNGDLTYFVEPDIELTAEQISSIPLIIAAVKQQLDSWNMPPAETVTNDDIVNISDDEDATSKNDTIIDSQTDGGINEDIENQIKAHTINEEVINNLDKALNTASSQSPESSTPQESRSGIEINVEENNVTDNVNKLANDDLNIHKENNDVTNNLSENTDSQNNDVSGTQNKNVKNDDVCDFNEKTNKATNDSENASTPNTTSRKTILSDLMEMSGICAEDTLNMSQENVMCGNTEEITAVTNVTIPNLPKNDLIPLPSILMNNISPQKDIVNDLIPELTPITSLSELKYACEQEDGQFFKLDLDTGVLLPINVCIKKHTKRNSSDINNRLKPIAPKQVTIDLTDDNDIIVQENKNSKPMMYENVSSRNNYKSLLKASTGHSGVKPIKIFQSLHANILRRRYRNNLTESKLCVELDKQKFRKRKQRLSHIEANINLVDSDAPMEEEYLMDSLDDCSDSSDDEPLASKAKRRKTEQSLSSAKEIDKIAGHSNTEMNERAISNVDKSGVPMDTNTDLSDDRSAAPDNIGTADNNQAPLAVTQVLTVPPASLSVTEAPSQIPAPSPDMESDITPSELPFEDDADEPPQISFFSDNDDSDGSQEDCILGV